MIDREVALSLHDRATRGEALAPEEQAELAAWYAEQDRAEFAALGLASNPGPAPEDLDRLRQQVADMMAEVAATAERIRAMAADNEQLRRENSALRRRLAQRGILTPA